MENSLQLSTTVACGMHLLFELALRLLSYRRLDGIGSTPSSTECAFWDDWAVSLVA